MAASHLSLRVKNVIPDPAEDPDNRALVTTLKPQRPPKSAALLLGLCRRRQPAGFLRAGRLCPSIPTSSNAVLRRAALGLWSSLQQDGAEGFGTRVLCSAGTAGAWFAAGGPSVRLLSCPARHLQGRPPHRTRRELMGCESHTRVVGPTNALTGQPFG